MNAQLRENVIGAWNELEDLKNNTFSLYKKNISRFLDVIK